MIRRRSLAFLGAALLAGAVAPLVPAQAADKILKVGVSAGPYGDILREAARLAAQDGLKAEIIEFTDWNQPNSALDAKEIDLNNFQHRPYLANQVKSRGYKLVPLDPSIVVPGGIFSQKVKSLADLPAGAKVGIPNNPTNATRALFLLQEAGVIKLRPGSGTAASTLDVVENPKRITFAELDAAQLPRSLGDLDASFVSNNYAHLAGLKLKDALIVETKNSEWTLVFAAREDRKDDPEIRKFISIYRSAPVKAFIEEKFKGSILPTW
ncbi:MAG: MetQ/NlpA family ABC transporter substrate-binding protein [Reyranella sp.]|uniref:MetQ/NlpA family ABC transporter substrate-binding protein n=1 Tax=Reyranella sp. TaxID=1929291 RepID=UPI0025CC8940|nr:MetQ/NlpA family ABC transporter substrate-binding protein [Reyranella sp.]MBR2814883.1 MetQ/NlpA family ABC transporter substrate-binding protein [Reyranella sp.]